MSWSRLGDASVIVWGMGSASGDWIRESGGEIGSSGRSSRNRDIVRFGTPGANFRGTKLVGGGCNCAVCIESLEVLENDEGPSELRLFLRPHLKMDVQESGPRELLVSDPFLNDSECSVLGSDSCGDLDRENFGRRKELLDLGLLRGGTGSSTSWGSAGDSGILLVRWKDASGSLPVSFSRRSRS